MLLVMYMLDISYNDIRKLLLDARELATGAKDIRLTSKLIDIQGVLYDLLEENKELKDQINQLENNKALEKRLTKVGRFWKDPEAEYLYCPKCYANGKLVVCDPIDDTTIGDVYECPNCGFTSSNPYKG